MRRVRSQFLQSAVVRLLPFTVRERGVADDVAALARSRGTGASIVALLGGIVGALGFTAAPVLAADCPNSAIRAQQGPGVEALPDCMGLEMVSPPGKFSQGARSPVVSASGARVSFRTAGGVGDPPGMVDTFFGDAYVASRGGGGWDTSATVPPDRPGEGMNFNAGWVGKSSVASFSPDMSRWFTIAATSVEFEEGVGRAFAGGLEGFFEPVSPLLVPLDARHGTTNVIRADLQGASADHSRFFFRAGDLATGYLPGDPSPAGSGSESNVYVAGDGGGGPSLELLTRDGEGTIWGGRCGSRVGGWPGAGGDQTQARDQGAISVPGGERVYFQTRPGQTGSGVCDSATNKLRIMERVETEDGPSIGPLLASECGRVVPACDTTDGDDLFQGASVDGQRVYFTSTRQLTDSDLDTGFSSCDQFFSTFPAAGCDLYLYDGSLPQGQRLVQVSAGDETHPTPGSGAGVLDGIAAISGDGSHVYFVATGVLTTAPNPHGATATLGEPNLYLYERNGEHPDGRIGFIGTASATDGALFGLWGAAGTFKGVAFPVPAMGENGEGEQVGGDGHVFFFESAAPFTPDDTDGGARDVFRYDADSGQLDRVSKAAPGGVDNATIDVDSRIATAAIPRFVGTNFAEMNRRASEDGDTVVFRTREGWLPDDTNGIYDVYMWRGDELYRLPGGSDGSVLGNAESVPERQPAVSHDGSVVAYVSPSQVLPEDGDSVADVYVARVDGGFGSVDPAVPCAPLASGCQGGGAGESGTNSRTGEPSGGNAAQTSRVRIAVGALTAAQRKRASARGVLPLRVRTSKAGLVRVSVRGRVGKRLRRVGKASKSVGASKAAVVRVRLAKPARAQLREGRALRLSVLVSAEGARSRTRTVRLPGAAR
jgi:hypothetical protein